MFDIFLKEVISGLNKEQKSLPSKYFYDKRGDAIFEEIMQMPSYYITKKELEILSQQASKIIQSLNFNKEKKSYLIELGAGNALKTKQLIKTMLEQGYNFSYIPIDISKNVVDCLQKNLKKEFPTLAIQAMVGEYFHSFDFQQNIPKCILFLGSNIGNMDDAQAQDFLLHVSQYMALDDKFILGVDMIKSKETIQPAYDDPEGITKKFNLNILERINRELGADFKITNFNHQFEYTQDVGICKSYLVSQLKQEVQIANHTFSLQKGEKIITEISRKYSDNLIKKITQNKGLVITDKFQDKEQYFTNYLFKKISKPLTE